MMHINKLIIKLSITCIRYCWKRYEEYIACHSETVKELTSHLYPYRAFPGSGPRSAADCERRWYNVQQKSKPRIAEYKNKLQTAGKFFYLLCQNVKFISVSLGENHSMQPYWPQIMFSFQLKVNKFITVNYIFGIAIF